MESLNLNNVTILPSGRVTFSGLTSGIDFQAVADAIIAAKQIPADRIALEIDENAAKIAEFQEFRDLLTEVKRIPCRPSTAPSASAAPTTFLKPRRPSPAPAGPMARHRRRRAIWSVSR
jgi:hypothetical protein